MKKSGKASNAKSEQITEIHYTFDDWKVGGNAQVIISTGRTTLKWADTKGDIYFGVIEQVEFEKIRAEQKKIFDERVAYLMNEYRSEFETRYANSTDRKRLVHNEIEKYELAIDPARFRLGMKMNDFPPINGLYFLVGYGYMNTAGIRYFRELYDKWVVQGKMDYSFILPGRFDKSSLHNKPVAVIALRKYLDWLKDLEAKGKWSKIKLRSDNVQVDKESSDSNIGLLSPASFSDIFLNSDWDRFISTLRKTNPPLLSESNEFIGKPRVHKGVVCSWFKFLQSKGIINQRFNRSQLASVLNNEIINFKLGADGKTFDNISVSFNKTFENQLLTLTGLLP